MNTIETTKQNFAKQMTLISVKAFEFIEAKLKEQPEYIFATQEQIENEEVDIYDLPDFEYFSKHGFSGEWASIIGIKEIIVTGIGKETEVTMLNAT
jgi:hypothetical protein